MALGLVYCSFMLKLNVLVRGDVENSFTSFVWKLV